MTKHKEVPKVWGKEIWLVNRDYCGKKLVLNKGFRCSMHYHKKKDETFYILKGRVLMETDKERKIMQEGDSILITPGLKHRFTGLENSEIMEFSTHHEDEDSYRTEPSGEVKLDGLNLPQTKKTTCLVTGGAGFIGSNLALELENQGYEVIVADNLLTGAKENLKGFKGEILNIDVSKPFKIDKKLDIIFHQAAITDPRFKDDKEMLRANVEGFKNMIELAKKNNAKLIYASTANLYGNGPTPMKESQKKELITAYGQSKLEMDKIAETLKDKMHIVGLRYFNCYDKNTEILTIDGFKLFKDVSEDDLIATLNPKTNELEYHKPTYIYTYKHKGRLIHFNKKRIDLMVTPDQNIYVKKRRASLGKLIKASEIIKSEKNYGLRFKQDCIWKGKSIEYEIIPSIRNDEKVRRLRISNKEKRIPMRLWLKFLGWFLSEGSVFSGITINYGKKVRYYRVNIAQREAKSVKEIVTIIKKIGLNCYISKNKRGNHDIIISSKQLYYHLKHFRKNKHIPKYIKSLNKEDLFILFNHLMKGDGAKDGSKYSTKYKKFADDFQEILLKIGKVGYVRGEKKHNFLIYRVHITTQCYPQIGNCEKQKIDYSFKEYNDYVYDVTVPNHIIFVRRNGRVCWSGNCFGPREAFKGRAASMVLHLSRQIKENKHPKIFKHGEQKRDHIYIKDVVNATIKAIDARSGIYNVGTGIATTFNDLIKVLNEVLGKNLEPEYFDSPYNMETYQNNTQADTKLAEKELGFKAQYTLKNGIKDYMEWLDKNGQ